MTLQTLTLAIGIVAVFVAIVGILQGFILAGQKRIQKDIADLWKRTNTHGHIIHCPNKQCSTLETGKVVIGQET
jgi:hypothetical protein